jgi:hypothetical protein
LYIILLVQVDMVVTSQTVTTLVLGAVHLEGVVVGVHPLGLPYKASLFICWPLGEVAVGVVVYLPQILMATSFLAQVFLAGLFLVLPVPGVQVRLLMFVPVTFTRGVTVGLEGKVLSNWITAVV